MNQNTSPSLAPEPETTNNSPAPHIYRSPTSHPTSSDNESSDDYEHSEMKRKEQKQNRWRASPEQEALDAEDDIEFKRELDAQGQGRRQQDPMDAQHSKTKKKSKKGSAKVHPTGDSDSENRKRVKSEPLSNRLQEEATRVHEEYLLQLETLADEHEVDVH